MDSKDLLRELESLKKRVSELESLKKDTLNMFGRSYSLAGSSNSDFLIKTKGLVKIQWGNKFIDLIKDGKINVNSKFIYRESNIGNNDGIYIVGDENPEVWAVVSGTQINLKGEVGNTYVSFLGEQQSTAELKRQALINVGFIYPDMLSITSSALQNGIIYIESEQKLYLIKDGLLLEYKIDIPNPITKPLIINKKDDNQGAIIILGTGIENSLNIEDLYIYNDSTSNIISSDRNFSIISPFIELVSNLVIIDHILKTNSIESISYSLHKGYKLYTDASGTSILDVDKVNERNKELSSIYPESWITVSNIIKSISLNSEEENKESTVIIFSQEHFYKIGDLLLIYNKSYIENEDKKEFYSPIILTVNNVIDDQSVEVVGLETHEDISEFLGKLVFLIKRSNNYFPIRIKNNNLDIVECSINNVDLDTQIKTRIGDLSKIYDEENTLEEYGIYTDCLILGGFEEKNLPKYTKTLNDLLLNVNMNQIDKYDCVLVSVGLLKYILKENLVNVEELKLRLTSIETDIILIKKELGL